MDLYAKLSELARTGQAAALCTIIETSGSTPRKAGSKVIVTSEGTTFGSVGGGVLEKALIKDALQCIESAKNHTGTYSSGHDSSGQSLGEAKIFIDPLPQKVKLYIFGSGHVGQAVARVAKDLDFEVFLIDPRAGLMELINIEGVRMLRGDYLTEMENLHFDRKCFIVVMTNTHESDEAVTRACTAKEHAYLGMIGSSRKVKEIRQSMLDSGMDRSVVDAVDMPIGIPINCETPAEIAISIMARLIDEKNK